MACHVQGGGGGGSGEGGGGEVRQGGRGGGVGKTPLYPGMRLVGKTWCLWLDYGKQGHPKCKSLVPYNNND